VARRSLLTRRQALRAGAVAATLGAVRLPSPAFAAPGGPSLFELDLAGVATGPERDGWRETGVLGAPRRFDLVGLRWDFGSHARAQVRARRRGGPWTPWVELHVSGDHAPDTGSEPAGTDPAFTGTADELQLRLHGHPRGLRARFVRALPAASLARRLARRARAARSGRQSQAAQTPFRVVTRAEWGASAVGTRAAPEYGAVEMAFVHHTVNANTYRPQDSAAIVLGIDRYHVDSNGWNDIGYNFLVDRYGQIFEGRGGGMDQPVIGAHAQGYNSVSTGIACLGTFESVALSAAGMRALAKVIGWRLSIAGVPVQGQLTVVTPGGPDNRYAAGTAVTLQRVSGHRDGDSTSCPGDTLYGQLPALRRKAAGHATPSTGLSMRPGRTVVPYQRTVHVLGSVAFPEGSSPDGASITLEYQAAGSAWSPVASGTAGPDGSWAILLTPPASGVWRAAFPGDQTRAAIVSRPVRIDVVPRLSLALDRASMSAGRRVDVTGTVMPDGDVQIVVERRVGGRWSTQLSRVATSSEGAYGLRIRLRTRGSYRITAIAGARRRRRRLAVV
jgi:hypothetical protein